MVEQSGADLFTSREDLLHESVREVSESVLHVFP